MEEEYIIAFIDILGSQNESEICTWNDYRSLDFANPVGIVAEHHPKLNFSVFSDSVIISAPTNELNNFWSVLSYLDTQWRADHIFTRGGVALGELRVVEHFTDNMFSKLKNYSGTRIYGSALNEAYNLENRSGPGAEFFLSEKFSNFVKRQIENSVLHGPVDIAIIHSKENIEQNIKVHRLFSEGKIGKNPHSFRQHKASLWYNQQILSNALFMKELYEYEAIPGNKEAMRKFRESQKYQQIRGEQSKTRERLFDCSF